MDEHKHSDQIWFHIVCNIGYLSTPADKRVDTKVTGGKRGNFKLTKYSKFVLSYRTYNFLKNFCDNFGPLVKSAYKKISFLISQPKYMLWVLKRTVSVRRFF